MKVRRVDFEMPEIWRIECKNNKYRLSREPKHSFDVQFRDFKKIWNHFKGDRTPEEAYKKLDGILKKARSSGHSNQECLDRFRRELDGHYKNRSLWPQFFAPKEDIPPIEWIEK